MEYVPGFGKRLVGSLGRILRCYNGLLQIEENAACRSDNDCANNEDDQHYDKADHHYKIDVMDIIVQFIVIHHECPFNRSVIFGRFLRWRTIVAGSIISEETIDPAINHRVAGSRIESSRHAIAHVRL